MQLKLWNRNFETETCESENFQELIKFVCRALAITQNEWRARIDRKFYTMYLLHYSNKIFKKNRFNYKLNSLIPR